MKRSGLAVGARGMIWRMTAEKSPAACAPEIAQIVERLRQGDVRALARAVSLVEDGAPVARQILSCCFPSTGGALRIGVTGPAGAGKSTLVDRLICQFRAQGTSVGVIAVDPTSPYTGGALLGDRIRMRANGGDGGLYIRSMATRGSLGGLAATAAEVASVIEASGKQRILIETVGAGQDEVDVVRVADLTMVLLVPGLGDDVQCVKAGIMEIADIFVINKSDREGADQLEKEVRALQLLRPSRARSGDPNRDPERGRQARGVGEEWLAPVVRTVATTGEGVVHLLQAIDECRLWLEREGRLMERREACWRERLMEMARQELLVQLRERGLTARKLEGIARQVARKEENPYQLLPQLIERSL